MKKKSIDHTQLLLLKLLSSEDMYGYQIILEIILPSLIQRTVIIKKCAFAV